MTTAITNLLALNTFRAIENLPAFADYRKARHEPMLVAFEGEYADAALSIADAIADAAALAAKANETTEVVTEVKAPRVTYKTLPHFVPSTVESPVAFVHGFLNANADMTRKNAVASLVNDHGVNYATARTQYQRWYAKRNAAANVPAEQEGTK